MGKTFLIMRFQWIALGVLILITTTLVGCLNQGSGDPSWDLILESASGTTVNFVVWSEQEEALQWFETVVKAHVLETSGVTLNLISMEKKEYIDLLRDDKLNERDMGVADLLWLDADTFNMLKTEGLLYGPFAMEIFNAKKWFSPRSVAFQFIEDIPTEGFALPFNQQQLTFYYNEDIIYDAPQTLSELKDALSIYSGMFTYPHPSDEVGGAFVRSVILNFTPSKAFVEGTLTKEALKELVLPGLEYLKSIQPNLYQSGQFYPSTASDMYDYFADGKVMLTMSLDYRHATTMTGDAIYPNGTRPFLLGSASVGPRENLSIPFHSMNKSGAMVVINSVLDMKIQTQKLASKTYPGLPVYDAMLLDSTDQAAIKRGLNRRTVMDIVRLMTHRQQDIPVRYHELIAELWYDHLFGSD